MVPIRKFRRSSIVHGEIRHRWPSLLLTPLNDREWTPDLLVAVLSEQLGFCHNRALMEAHGFWKDLEERFRLAAAA